MVLLGGGEGGEKIEIKEKGTKYTRSREREGEGGGGSAVIVPRVGAAVANWREPSDTRCERARLRAHAREY